jgi:hypothetical protein
MINDATHLITDGTNPEVSENGLGHEKEKDLSF